MWVHAINFYPQTAVEKWFRKQGHLWKHAKTLEIVAFYPDSIRNYHSKLIENLSELSTFRISYPQFLGIYPQFCGKIG